MTAAAPSSPQNRRLDASNGTMGGASRRCGATPTWWSRGGRSAEETFASIAGNQDRPPRPHRRANHVD